MVALATQALVEMVASVVAVVVLLEAQLLVELDSTMDNLVAVVLPMHGQTLLVVMVELILVAVEAVALTTQLITKVVMAVQELS